MPYCRAEYLVLLFYELGICGQGANGVVPISWTEINSWLTTTDRELEPWEVTLLRDMSKAYVNEYYNGTDKFSKTPYVEDEVLDKVKQAEVMEDFFEMMIFQQNSKSQIIEE